MKTPTRIGIVVIGRNEGERLKRCLQSLPADADCVYVDSGSQDGSQDFARSLGLDVVDLPMDTGFTAARARNAGVARIAALPNPPAFVQMLDGDCELRPGWIDAALKALSAEASLAAVFGRLRERFPDASPYNRMCDEEWNVPVGLVRSCSGNAMFRLVPLAQSGGYDATLIAGEEIDLCLRLAAVGWTFRRIDADMALHDVAMLHFAQWWQRTRRAGFAFAEHVWRRRGGADSDWKHALLRIIFWALLLPCSIMLALLSGYIFSKPMFCWAALVIAALYPLQWVRVALRSYAAQLDARYATYFSIFSSLDKFAQLSGAVQFLTQKMLRRSAKIIEHKV